jgi:hypothetical protein
MAVVFHQPLPYIVGACVMAAVVLWAHRGNMVRLWHRTESRVTFPWNKRGTPQQAEAAPIRRAGYPAGPVADVAPGRQADAAGAGAVRERPDKGGGL